MEPEYPKNVPRTTTFQPSWTRLETPPPPSGKSGLTSSDDAPRYRRGSKRKPKPPKTPPGLVQTLHKCVAIANFEGKGRGYAAVREIPASSLLLQERPLEITGEFESTQEARRAMARAVVGRDALTPGGCQIYMDPTPAVVN